VPVEFHRRTLALIYYAMAIVFVIFGILFGMIALGDGITPGPWGSKIVGVLEWSLTGLVWMCSAPAIWLQARKYRHTLVRLSDHDIFIHTAGGKPFTIPYSLIQSVDCDARLLTIHTAEIKYTFDKRAIPQLAHIAKALREHVVTT
jgi:hypothetical protein